MEDLYINDFHRQNSVAAQREVYNQQIQNIKHEHSNEKKIADYFKTQPVLKVWIFGSYARGEETPASDIDIIVSLDHSQPIGLKFFNMWEELEKMLNCKVDLVEEGGLSPYAIESANKDKILIYERTTI